MTQTTTTTKSNSKPRATKKDKKGEPSLLKNVGVAPRPDLISLALDHYGIEHDANIAANVAKLRDASAAVAAKDAESCVNCDKCGDFAEEAAFDICPFCGHDGTVPATAAAAGEPAPESAQEPTPEPTPASSVAIVPSADAVGELTRRTERVRGLMRDMAGNGYDLGLELAEIHGSDLWKAGGFDSFKSYCAGAAGVSHTLAYQLIEVATKTAREDFLAVGQTKLAIVVRAPEAERAELLDAAKKGETAAKLQDRAKTARANAKAKAAGKPAPAAKAPAPVAAEVKRGRPREEDQTIRLAATVNGRPKTVKWSTQTGKKREEVAVWAGEMCFAPIPVAAGIELCVRLALNRKKECVGLEYVYTRTGE